MTTGNEAEKLNTEEAETSGVEEEVEASTESTGEAEAQATEVEAWMQTEDQETAEESDGKPAKLSTKQKLRAKLGDAEGEVAQLRAEVEALKGGQVTEKVATSVKRPRVNDFDTDDEYEAAMDTWEDSRLEVIASTFDNKKATQQSQQQRVAAVETAVSGHYDRAQELINKHSISADAYFQADLAVKQAVEGIAPGRGEAIFNHLIDTAGEGSEKLMYHLGVNKQALNDFRAILTDDPTGLKAAAFIGRKQAEIEGTQTQTSRARKPAKQIQGDAQVSGQESAFKKKYKASKSPQERLDIKTAARIAGFDTKNWIKE